MDRFATPVTFKSGVRWEPAEYLAIDQTPYLAYLDKQEDGAHHWNRNGNTCLECEANISWCDHPHVWSPPK